MSTDFVRMFQSFRTILCVCPCCGQLTRLSDLRLKYKGKVPHTWLDTHDTKLKRLQTREEQFNEQEIKIREAAHERARKKVPKLICKCIDKGIVRLKYNPYDIKTLLHPVDFVVFNGLNNEKKLEGIIFLSKGTREPGLNKIRNSLSAAIDDEKYDWHIARVSIEGNIEIE
jgi:predicted Holliday junction resolvase-like endonuclease